MKKVVVNGVDGSFGGVVAQKITTLLSKEQLVFTAPKAEALQAYKAKGIQTAEVNFMMPESLDSVLKGADKALLISMPFIGEKRRTAHRQFVDACVRSGVKQIVYISLMDASNAMNKSVEKIDHGYTESYIQRQDINYIILRNSQYAEAMVSAYCASAQDGTNLMQNNMGDGKVALISRRDCAEAAAYALANPFLNRSILNINGAEALDMASFVQIGNEQTGNHVAYKAITDEEMYQYFDSLGVPRTTEGYFDPKSPFQFASDGMVTFGQAVREGHFSIKTNDFQSLTGRKPLTVAHMFAHVDDFQIGSRNSVDD